MVLEQEIKNVIRDVPNFPKEGIMFKDITPILQQPALCEKITQAIAANAKLHQVDAVLGIESRGFLFGMLVARLLNVPFIPIRKAGKLPYTTIREEYDLEYARMMFISDKTQVFRGNLFVFLEQCQCNKLNSLQMHLIMLILI